MLKLNASYSKKVPADGEYTSQSYHASIEVELPDGLSAEQLNGKIHETFEIVRNSVEAELHGNTPIPQGGNGRSRQLHRGLEDRFGEMADWQSRQGFASNCLLLCFQAEVRRKAVVQVRRLHQSQDSGCQ